MICNLKNKGTITQRFLQNLNPLYQSQGLVGHTGLDTHKGYGKPVYADNRGYVYKIIREGDLPSNWQAVYLICDDKMEIAYGHLSRVDVQEGDWVEKDQQIGLEGNKGDVYQGTTRITPEMQKAGDTRGSHLHESWRPVTKVYQSLEIRGAHYLRGKNGKAFSKDGCLYEITYDNPQTNGMIDPLLYAVQDKQGLIASLTKQLAVLRYALSNKMKKDVR